MQTQIRSLAGGEMSPTLLYHLQGVSAAHPGPFRGMRAVGGFAR